MKARYFDFLQRTNTILRTLNTSDSFIVTVPTFTARAVLSEMIASSTGDRVPATGVGAHCVDAGVARQAWTAMGHTLVYI